MKNLEDIFSDGTALFSERGNQLLTLADMSAAVTNVIGRLPEHGAARCAIFCEDNATFTVLLWAVLLSGRKAIILPNRNIDFLQAIRPYYDVVLTDNDVLWHSKENSSINAALAARLQTELDSVDIVFFTSGSTGEPKAIHKTLAHLLAEVQMLEQLWGKKLGDSRVLGTVSQQHLYGFLFRSLWPLLSGRISVSEQQAFPEQLQRSASQHAATVISSPALLRRLPDLIDLSGVRNNIRAVFSSGGPLPNDSALQLQQMLQQPIIEVLGSTETGGFAWRTQQDLLPEQSSAEPLPAEPPTAQQAWQLFPDMSINAQGETLWLHSPFLSEPFALDDGGIIDGEGKLQLHGRRDCVVKIEEKRVSLKEIEQRLLVSDWVTVARALAIKKQREQIAAVLVLSDAGKTHLQQLGRRAFCVALDTLLETYFDRTVMPKKWRFVDAMPQNDMGKTTKSMLESLFSHTAPVLFPEVLAQCFSEDAANIHFRLPENLLYFSGHFPRHPVLPGVVQIEWACHYMRCCFGVTYEVRSMEAIKFQQLLMPLQEIKLSLRLDRKKGKLHFEYGSDDKVFSSGRLLLEDVAEI